MSSVGLFIRIDTAIMMYDIREQDFIQLIDYDTTWDGKPVSYKAIKTFFSGDFYSREEKKEYMRHKLFSYSTQYHYTLSLVVVERDIMVLNGETITVFLKNKTKESFFYDAGVIEKEKLFECFLFLLRSGERMLALNDEDARKQHCVNMKKVKDELECKPNVGVRFMEAYEEFRSVNALKHQT